jgi:hypothetical protein
MTLPGDGPEVDRERRYSRMNEVHRPGSDEQNPGITARSRITLVVS